MNLGSIVSSVAKALPGLDNLVPGLGPAKLVASLLLDTLKGALPQLLQGKAAALPEGAAQAIIDRMASGFLKGLKS